MQIDITGHQMDVTDALRQRVEETIKKLGNHTDSPIGRTHIVMEVVKQQHHCDIQITIGNDNFVAKDHADNMYVAIDRAADKIYRQMQNVKNHHKDARRR